MKSMDFRGTVSVILPPRISRWRNPKFQYNFANSPMVIRSSSPTTARIVSPQDDPRRPSSDNPALRPKSFDEYVGQSEIVDRLRVAVASAKIRKEPLEHVLFYGPPGLGKTTLANIVAHEMSAHLRQTSGPACQKPSDLVSILTGLKE